MKREAEIFAKTAAARGAALQEFPCAVANDAFLAPHTSFGIGGIARRLFLPQNVSEMRRLLSLLAGTPYRVLGGGTNVLIASNVIEEPVILVPHEHAVSFHEGGDGRVLVEASAGTRLQALVRETAAQGLAGLEGLIGIPGSVGGAVAMNAGGKYGAIGERVESVEVVARDGASRVLKRDEINFGYRSGNLGGATATAATFVLEKRRPDEVSDRMLKILAEKRASQPLNEKSAGCVFKNPEGLSAGRLIEEAGLKGESRGDAVVSSRHANFIVNRGHATAEDVLSLIEVVRKKIKGNFGLALALEIELWY